MPLANRIMQQFDIPSEQAMLALGEQFAENLKPGLVVFLGGDLGAGKTTLVRGMLGHLGHSGAVTSPTYTLVEPYALSGQSVFHFDLYRLKVPEELEMIGIRDMLGSDSICLIEWPEKGRGILPVPDWDIVIEVKDELRKVSLEISR